MKALRCSAWEAQPPSSDAVAALPFSRERAADTDTEYETICVVWPRGVFPDTVRVGTQRGDDSVVPSVTDEDEDEEEEEFGICRPPTPMPIPMDSLRWSTLEKAESL